MRSPRAPQPARTEAASGRPAPRDPSPAATAPPLRWQRRAPLLLAAAYLALALHGLGASDIVGDDEAREVGIARDVAAGHVLLPRFNREILPDKPILFHWLAAVPCAISGFSETAVRLPSAIAGAALVGWTTFLGIELFGPPAGLAAGVLVATMPSLFDRARVARPDALFVFCLSLALGLAFRWWRGGRRRDATLALACLGAATFAKGPVGPVLFALTVGGFLCWQRELGRIRALATAPGLLALAVLGLGWYAVALGGWGELFVREHLVGRYARNLAGGLVTGQSYSHRPLSYHLRFYFLHLPAIALPWTPLAAITLWQAWRRDRLADPRLRFLLCWLAAPVVAFTPAEWKLRHYLLPALPALALLAAPAALALWRPARQPARMATTLLAAVGLGAVAIGVTALVTGHLTLSRSDRQTVDALVAAIPGGMATGLWLVGLAAGSLTLLAAFQAWRPTLTLVALAIAGWMLLGVPALERSVSARDSLKGFARAVATHPERPASFVTWGEPVRPVLVYLDEPVPRLPGPAAATPGLGVIAIERAYARLSQTTPLSPPLLVAEGRIGNLGRGRVMMGVVANTP